MIELTLVPTGRRDLITAEHNGLAIVTSRQPFYDGARNLLVQGVAPETQLQARWKGSDIVAMRSTVGEAAKWAVGESDERGLQLRKWEPHPMAVSRERQAAENALKASGREDEASESQSASLSTPAHASVDRHGTLSHPVDN